MTSLSCSRELLYVILSFLAVMVLGLQLPSLPWLQRLKLLGLAVSCLLTSNLNILALKVTVGCWR